MKRMTTFLLSLAVMTAEALTMQANEPTVQETTVAENYLIVVGTFNSESAGQDLLKEMKKNHKQAGIYKDPENNRYYVYIERYYSKHGAEYAVWWHKKNTSYLPKVWHKPIPADA